VILRRTGGTVSATSSGAVKTEPTEVHGRRKTGSSFPRSERLETLKRIEPQESNALAARLITGRREADSDEVPDPEGGRRAATWPDGSGGATRRLMNVASVSPSELRSPARHGGDVKRGADAERHYDFVWREKL
jgi:hypothetical protein